MRIRDSPQLAFCQGPGEASNELDLKHTIQEEEMNLKLSAPSQIVWIIALILGIVGILGYLGIVAALGTYAFWAVVVGWALLVIATIMRGM
jgi:hypothetical protein